MLKYNNAGEQSCPIFLGKAIDVTTWNTTTDALLSINYPDPNVSNLPEFKKPALWKFEFSDGTVITQEYKNGWYTIQPNRGRDTVFAALEKYPVDT